MDALTAFWHVANFAGLPLLLGLIAATATRLVWRRQLVDPRWPRLVAWAAVAAFAAQLAGLVLWRHDGRMATYAAMVVAVAAALWWAGFRRVPAADASS